jgi:hypothetical protein
MVLKLAGIHVIVGKRSHFELGDRTRSLLIGAVNATAAQTYFVSIVQQRLNELPSPQ